MSIDADAEEFMKLLSQSVTSEEGNSERPIRYSHMTAPPVPDGAVGVPELVAAFLTATDGADLFCASSSVTGTVRAACRRNERQR